MVQPPTSQLSFCSFLTSILQSFSTTLERFQVGGSFHIAPGKSFSINHVHVHDIQPFSSTDFNVTHRIRHLSFGPKIDGQGNPLDGVIAVADKGAMMFQYYIKIVPTTYAKVDGSLFLTSQVDM